MLSQYLRTPAGVLWLIGLTYAASVLLAAGAVCYRGYFERFTHEKYAPASEAAASLGRQLIGAAEDAERVQRLTNAEKGALYEAWMQAGNAWSESAPAAMLQGAPAYYLQRARLTMYCGSDEQRRRVVLFLRLGGIPDAAPLLIEFLNRAQARREKALAEEIRDALNDARLNRNS